MLIKPTRTVRRQPVSEAARMGQVSGASQSNISLPRREKTAWWQVPILGQSGPRPPGEADGTAGLLPRPGLPVFLALSLVNAVFLRNMFHVDLYCPDSETDRTVTAFRGSGHVLGVLTSLEFCKNLRRHLFAKLKVFG